MRKAENAAGEREGGGGAVGVHVVRALPRWPSVDLACRWQAPGGSAWRRPVPVPVPAPTAELRAGPVRDPASAAWVCAVAKLGLDDAFLALGSPPAANFTWQAALRSRVGPCGSAWQQGGMLQPGAPLSALPSCRLGGAALEACWRQPPIAWYPMPAAGIHLGTTTMGQTMGTGLAMTECCCGGPGRFPCGWLETGRWARATVTSCRITLPSPAPSTWAATVPSRARNAALPCGSCGSLFVVATLGGAAVASLHLA